ncbi:AtpZ/AtpI family protein [Methylobacterium sp. J-048]|uniref:AtpZ/AtpI family protein n=1 Tax=Methylobacterium sp. J-048 TaxID=2836635 RepID=UPI001FB90A42|nr:AtpZ/AtpI family protein [Methylobacterium sp. J-048]MCJ2055424.1 AtpZ/AtpI family protein [Methylobacterium sp. J-048]
MSGDDSRDGNGTEGTPTDSELSARLRHLETQIERKRPQAAPDPSSRPRGTGPSSLGQAMTISTEFVAGVIAGGILGWIVDHVFGTKPWGLIVLLMLGFVVGIYNVMRVSGFAGARPGRGDRQEP